MKNNANKKNMYDVNSQKITVNLNKNNNNFNIHQEPLYQEYPDYYNTNNDKSMMDEIKNVKYQEYLEPNTYSENNLFTEYNSLTKYTFKPLSIYKYENMPQKDFESAYNNTNGNINNDRRLILNNQNNKNLYKIIYNNDNYSSRAHSKQKRIASLKGNKRINFHKNSNCDDIDENSKTLINQKLNFQKGTKLNISKSSIEYPLNFTNNIIRNKTKYKSYKNTISEENDNNCDENEGLIIKIPKRQINKSKKKEIGKYYISTPNICNSSRKKLRQNKNSFVFINRRKNNEKNLPDNIDVIHIPNMKTTNCNSYNTINTYNSCSNFYQKSGDSNNRPKNEIYINMHNSNNNYGYLNTNNSVQEFNKINPLYTRMNNHEDIYINENENGSDYINNLETDYKNNNTNANINNNTKNIPNYNDGNYINENNNYLKLKPILHMKGQKSFDIRKNLNLNSREIQFSQNFAEVNKFINFQKNLIEKFCKYLEEYMYINIKIKFYRFIFRLRLLCQEKEQNTSILKRLQKKGKKSNAYKEKEKERALSYKYIEHNNSNHFYSSVAMNNSNINIFRKNDFILKEQPSNEYISRNNLYENEEKKYFYNNFEKERFEPNCSNRMGKSQEKFYTRELTNDKYYVNDKNNKNCFYEYDYEKKNKKIKERQMNSLEKYGNNLYIPKKFKKTVKNPNHSNNINTKSKPKTKPNNNNNNYCHINDYLKVVNSQKNILKKMNIDNDLNKSHDLDDEIIRAKIKKNYNINYVNNAKNIQDMSYDANINNDNKLSINKELENGVLNQIKVITKENTNILPIKAKKESKKKPVYKKKIKITQAKSKIYPNKRITKDNIINNNYRKGEKMLSPNMRQIPNNNFEKVDKIKFPNSSNKKDNVKSTIKTENIEIHHHNNNNNNNNDIEESIKTDDFNNKITQIGNTNQNIKEINNNNNNNDYNKNKIININENGNNIEIKKTIEERNNDEINNNNNHKIENINNDNINNENINENNNENDLIGSNGNNNINDDTEESDDNIREVIVKDVSTKDRRLNVYIKYIELTKFNKIHNSFTNSVFILNSFHTDSIYCPAIYPRKYYSNYFYGSHNSKLKLHNILSSIIEEEEKSKAAGSVNNSILSEEENHKNGNYNSKQIVKYVTTFLQSFLDDKKKDKYFQFFKTLKRIKNEAFLKGLINQKKNQGFKIIKQDKDNDNEEENENENNTSGDVIIYNVNDNFNSDINYFGSKSKELNSQLNNSNNKEEHKDAKNINEIKDAIEFEDDASGIDKKYKTSCDINNINNLSEEHLDSNYGNTIFSMDNIESNKSNKNRNNPEVMTNVDEKKENKNEENIKKLKEILGRIEEYKNLRIVQKYFIEWGKMSKVYNNENDDNDINNSLENDYSKNVTLSEACRSLSDVFLDFKIYLIKYSLKKDNQKN